MNPPPPIPAPEGEVPPHHECCALIETDNFHERSRYTDWARDALEELEAKAKENEK